MVEPSKPRSKAKSRSTAKSRPRRPTGGLLPASSGWLMTLRVNSLRSELRKKA